MVITNYECDPYDKKQCVCKKPYTGNLCYDCIEGFYKLKGKCISQENCNENYCNKNGICRINFKMFGENYVKKDDDNIECLCDKNFVGKFCDVCADVPVAAFQGR